jgi:hypothetical protein
MLNNYLERFGRTNPNNLMNRNCSAVPRSAQRSVEILAIIDIDSPSTGSLPPRSRPLPQPHTSAAAVLVYELNTRDFDRSSDLFRGVFASTQFAIH